MAKLNIIKLAKPPKYSGKDDIKELANYIRTDLYKWMENLTIVLESQSDTANPES